MLIVGQVLHVLLSIAVYVVIARFIIDWIQLLARQWVPRGVVAVICEIIFTLTDPPLRAIRRVVKPIRLGGMALDLSPMILLISLFVAQAIVAGIVRAAFL